MIKIIFIYIDAIIIEHIKKIKNNFFFNPMIFYSIIVI